MVLPESLTAAAVGDVVGLSAPLGALESAAHPPQMDVSTSVEAWGFLCRLETRLADDGCLLAGRRNPIPAPKPLAGTAPSPMARRFVRREDARLGGSG